MSEAEWKAPTEDGGVLLVPRGKEISTAVQRNIEHWRAGVGGPWSELRAVARQELGLKDAPVIAAGHQVELWHPGVWIKNVVIDRVARQMNGVALHVAVDTDVPKHLHLRWPGGGIEITDDLSLKASAWTGHLAAPSPGHVRLIWAEARRAAEHWGFEPVSTIFLTLLEKQVNAGGTVSLAQALTAALRGTDEVLGLAYEMRLGSAVWSTRAFLAFVCHLMSDARAFATCYNDTLRGIRAQLGIRGRVRPVPDLTVLPEAVEAPFWLDDLRGGSRARPSVFDTPEGFLLEMVGGEEFLFRRNVEIQRLAIELDEFFRVTGARFSPRALTLTMFLRLFVADWFVHGIGGARYDRVTDGIIQSFFGLPPPDFGVATGTLYFPLALGMQRTCVSCVKQQLRHDRYAVSRPVREPLARQIEGLPPRSRERAELFGRLHEQQKHAELQSEVLEQSANVLSRAMEQHRAEEALFDRELCYVLQPRDRLALMIHSTARLVGD